MQEELHDQPLLVPWTESANQAYEDIPLDNPTRELLVHNPPSPASQIHLQQAPREQALKDQQLQQQQQRQQERHTQHHSDEQQHHNQHHQQQQQQQPHLHSLPAHQPQLQQLQDSSKNFSYLQQGLPYAAGEVNSTARRFEYADDDLIACPQLDMRSDNRMTRSGEAEVSPEKGWKRKREEEGCLDEDQYKSPVKFDSNQKCDVCGESASGHYFGALVCLPCKSFFIRCTKDGRPSFNSQCGGKCDVLKGGRVRCQHCRFQKCINAGMYRKEKPEAVEPAEGQLLCKVCGDIANGVHFGVTTCEGCKKFFRRGLKENKSYTCKGKMKCSINPRMRNNCRYCRYQKCLFEGMSREAIKMGRPKKGELVYRRSLKKNGYKHIVRPATIKPMSVSSPRASLTTEYEYENQDDTASEEAFDSASSRSQNIEISHQQLNSHLHSAHHHQHLQQQQQHEQQQQQQQPMQPPMQPQAGGYSLGSLLHDCMTVDDWEDKPYVVTTSHDVQISPPPAIAMSSNSRQGLENVDIKTSPSPHAHHSVHSNLIPMLPQHSHHHIHEQQLHCASPHQASNLQLLGHVQESQTDSRHHQSPTVHVGAPHRLMSYQDKDNVHNDSDTDQLVIANLDNAINSHLPVARLKEESVDLVNNGGVPFSDGAILEGMQTLQTLSKVDFQNCHLPGIDTTAASFSGRDHASALLPVVGGTTVPICQLEPSVITLNVNQRNIIYTHADREMCQSPSNRNSHHSNLEQDPALLGGESSSIIIETNLGPQVVDMSQKHEESTANHTHIISPQGNIRIDVTPCNIIRSPHSGIPVSTPGAPPGIIFSNRKGLILHQHVAEPRAESAQQGKGTPMKSSLFKTENPLPVRSSVKASVPSSGQPNNIISQAMAIASSSMADVDGQVYLLQGTIGTLANMPEEHSPRDQSYQFRNHGTPSSNQVLDNDNQVIRVSTERNLAKYSQSINSQIKEEVGGHRRQRLHNYSNSPPNDLQFTEQLSSINRITPPNSVRHHENSSPHNVNTSESYALGRRCFENRSSDSYSNSSEPENQSQNYHLNTTRSPVVNNGDIYVNNTGTSFYQRKTQVANSPDLDSDMEPLDDTFSNTKLLSDTAVLHGINRIFLGIDNSCDSHGCKHYKATRSDSFMDQSFLNKMSPNDFLPELSHMYWHSFRPLSNFVPTTEARKRVILEVLNAFDNLQKTYANSEPEYTDMLDTDQWEQWHLVQRRIARHVVAGQRFCRNIPGYFKLDIHDRISLGKHAGFGLMVLLACTEFYDPEFKRFRFIWNLTLPSHNPLFSYKVHLLSLGARMHEAGVDRTEAALLCAISMTSIDCPSIRMPSTICDVRDTLIEALDAHESARMDSTDRVLTLLSFMPQVRHMTVWYNNLMKKMSLPTEALKGKTGIVRTSPAAGSVDSKSTVS